MVVHDRSENAFSLFLFELPIDLTNRWYGLAIYLQQPHSRDAECCSPFDLVCHIMSTNEEVFPHDMWGDPGWAEHIPQFSKSQRRCTKLRKGLTFRKRQRVDASCFVFGHVREGHTSRLLEVQMPFFRLSKWVRYTLQGLLRPLPREMRYVFLYSAQTFVGSCQIAVRTGRRRRRTFSLKETHLLETRLGFGDEGCQVFRNHT